MAVLLGFIHLNIADISHLSNYPSKLRVEFISYFIIAIIRRSEKLSLVMDGYRTFIYAKLAQAKIAEMW
mgnify:CR=1 FL=1